MKHWTALNEDSFKFAMFADFIDQVLDKLTELKIGQKEFAKNLNITFGELSKFICGPNKLNLNIMIKMARILNLKMTVLVYDDNDIKNQSGPINSFIFKTCWEKIDKPISGYGLEENIQAKLK